MEILNVDLSEIELEDKSFYIPFNIIPPDLKTSIDTVGVINPPLLLLKSGKYIIATGWKRIQVCKQLGINKINSKVLQENELSLHNIIKLIYEDNKHRYSDVETGQLASIFIKFQDDIPRFLELIGLPRSEKNIERYSQLSSADKQIVDLYLENKINPDQVFILSQLNLSDAMILANRIIIPFRFNSNETRDFIKDLLDVLIRDRIAIGKILDDLLNSGENNNKDKIRYTLKCRRYPALMRSEDKFSDLIKKLKLPKNININHSPFFESNFIEIIIRASKESQLKELKDLLETDNKYALLNDLISLVKDGK